ncbi:hypothetical protein DXV75_15415 [Alteromonas aestuariivivens]|uniref:OmpA-like domain-containing protein n=1 Tax=Alteromonas aestuariivivens TaxID=1938339 RepID=A0A3D8M3B0_9ALTE|nr:sortase-associated OmpA-like protein PdsO [Alteromonas aestuariivivens]RDV24213.1 hypothetical protein DXV75_15415 [Alteromonas aestuariivivens]
MKSIRRTAIVVIAGSGLLALPVSAAKAESEKVKHATAVGLGTGAVVGTLVAGPAGAIVAGLIGAMIGKDTAQETELESSRFALNAAQKDLLTMRESLLAMQQEVRLQTTRVSLDQVTSEQVMSVQSSLQFTTGSYTIEPAYHEQLELVAKALRTHPQLRLQLTGHADSRGDEKFNQALSMQRALSVKGYLTDLGVNAEQILTVAVGEKGSRSENTEQLFFDRKVVLQLSEDEQVLTASR